MSRWITMALGGIVALALVISLYSFDNKELTHPTFSHSGSCLSCKPDSAIMLDVQVQGGTDPGQPFELLISTCTEDQAVVSVSVDLPPGMIHRAGKTSWSGSLKGGQIHKMKLDLAAPDMARHQITVSVECQIDANTKFAKCTAVVLNDQPATPKGVLKKNGSGENIIDFQQ